MPSDWQKYSYSMESSSFFFMKPTEETIENTGQNDESPFDLLESRPGFVSDYLEQIVAAQVEIAAAIDTASGVMDVALRHAMALTSADGAILKTVEGDEAIVSAAAGLAAPYHGLRVPLVESLAVNCIRTGIPEYYPDRRSSDNVVVAESPIDFLSLLVVPLKSADRVVGAVLVLSVRQDAFTDQDIIRLNLISGLTATAINHAAASEATIRLLEERTEALRQLQENQSLYLASLDAIQEGYVIHDREGVMLSCNAGAERILGASAADLIGKDHSVRNFSFVDESGNVVSGTMLPRSLVLKTNKTQSAIVGVLLNGRVTQWLSMSAAPLYHIGEYEPYSTVTTFYDVTESRASEASLRLSEERLQEAQRIAGIGSWEIETDGWHYWMSEEMYRIFGLDSAESAPSHTSLMSHFHEEDLAVRDKMFGRAIIEALPFEFDTRIAPANGGIKWCHVRGNPVVDHSGKVVRLTGTMIDITSRKLIEEDLREYGMAVARQKEELEHANVLMDSANQRLQMLAIEDGMTGLHNHRAFQERLAAEVESAKRYGSELSLIMLDVDNFKQYNDAYGHPEGDLIIKKLAELLKENSRESDSAARYGGEEFALILPQTGVDGASAIAERIRRAVAGTVWQKRYVTISLGIATLTSALDNPRDIIASADEALYRSKHQGRNCVTVADFNEIRQTNSN